MFQYRVESFFTHYILEDKKQLGHVKEYAIKIEFQECSSPHAHCLLWANGAQVENENQNDSDAELEHSTLDQENNEEENTPIITNDIREHRELMEDHSATENSHLLTGRPTANAL